MIIGFTGPAGSGKSTACELIMEHYAWVDKIGFADPIRRFMDLLGVTYTRETKELPHHVLCGASPRHAMQTLGTEWGRDTIGPELWIRSWEQRVRDSANPIVLVEDVRFVNEARAVRAMGGKIVRLEGRGGIVGDHPSETELKEIEPDVVIRNDGDRDALFRLLNLYIKEWA